MSSKEVDNTGIVVADHDGSKEQYYSDARSQDPR